MSTTLQETASVIEVATAPERAGPFVPTGALAKEVLQAEGRHGRMSEIARELDVERRRLYELRGRAEALLAREFDLSQDDDAKTGALESDPPDDQVLFSLPVTVAHLKRASIALRVIAPASIRDIVALLPVLFGEEASLSFGTIQSTLTEAGRRAADSLRSVALSSIDGVVLDEMFSQNRPVLAGLDPATQYLFLLATRPSRTGEEWNKALEKLRDGQGLTPERVVKDAGTGLAKGVTATWSGTEQRDDTFHAIREFGQARFYLERRAFGAVSKEYECEERRAQVDDEERRRRAGQRWRQAKEHAAEAIERFDAFERLCERAHQYLKLMPPGTGELYAPEEIRSALQDIGLEMMEIDGPHARKAGRYLKNRAPGLALHLKGLGEELSRVTEEAGGSAMAKAAARLYQATLDERSRTTNEHKRTMYANELRAAIRELATKAKGDAARVQQAMKAIFPVLDKRERASSAIENFNSVLRPYLVVHKNVEQNFLDLFRFYWNMRAREWGRGKGTSAYQQLTGVRVSDWLKLLGYPACAPTIGLHA